MHQSQRGLHARCTRAATNFARCVFVRCEAPAAPAGMCPCARVRARVCMCGRVAGVCVWGALPPFAIGADGRRPPQHRTLRGKGITRRSISNGTARKTNKHAAQRSAAGQSRGRKGRGRGASPSAAARRDLAYGAFGLAARRVAGGPPRPAEPRGRMNAQRSLAARSGTAQRPIRTRTDRARHAPAVGKMDGRRRGTPHVATAARWRWPREARGDAQGESARGEGPAARRSSAAPPPDPPPAAALASPSAQPPRAPAPRERARGPAMARRARERCAERRARCPFRQAGAASLRS